MEAKEKFFDRIDQSFILLKWNFKHLFIPLFLYNILSYIIFFILFFGLIFFVWTSLSKVQNIASEQLNPSMILENFWVANLTLSVVLVILWIISILILYIPFFIWTVKSIKQAYSWENINCKENIISSFWDILKSFKTYWYIFAYVFLIPFLVFIVAGLVFIFWTVLENSLLNKIAWIIFIFSILSFVIIAIYRWLRSTFSIYSAVDKNEYTKENFNFSISITKSKLWRIFWNFALILIITSVLSSMLNWVIWAIIPWSWSSEITETGNHLKDVINGILILKEYMFSISYVLESLATSVISTFFWVFMLVFSYVFFKRLEIENSPKE